jgi:hypothetical protein
MQQSADKGQTAHGSDLHLVPVIWRGSWDTTKAVKDKMSAVEESSRSTLHPDCSSDVRTGTLGYFHPVYSLMLPNCVGSTDART